tara:strand:- start:215 stop:526 length:312 start_codon:yes stop_codon:yes gene_type:complete
LEDVLTIRRIPMSLHDDIKENNGKEEVLFDIAGYKVYMTIDHGLRWNSGTWKAHHKMWVHDPDTGEYIELSDCPDIKSEIKGVQAVQLEEGTGMFGWQIRWKV